MVDPFGRGLLLRLPAVGDAPDGSATWLIELDAQAQRVPTKALWPGANEPAPPTEVTIPAPVRTATAAIAGREHLQANLTVVDDKDPLLVFGEDGVRLPSGVPLPAGPTWLLFPGDPTTLVIQGDPRQISESPLPPGWSGWCLLLIDLANVTSLNVTGYDKVHTVRTHSAARVAVGEPVSGVRTTAGQPVYASVPVLHLPDDLNKADWRVTVLDSDGEPLGTWSAREDQGGHDGVWQQVARPLLGTYTIRVRGPWGRGASRTVAIAEGLGVTFTPAWRRFTPDGLQATVATIRTAPGMTVTNQRVELTQKQRGVTVRLGSGTATQRLQLSPPHMSIAYEGEAGAPTASTRPLTIFREDVRDAAGTLILDVGLAAEPEAVCPRHKRRAARALPGLRP